MKRFLFAIAGLALLLSAAAGQSVQKRSSRIWDDMAFRRDGSGRSWLDTDGNVFLATSGSVSKWTPEGRRLWSIGIRDTWRNWGTVLPDGTSLVATNTRFYRIDTNGSVVAEREAEVRDYTVDYPSVQHIAFEPDGKHFAALTHYSQWRESNYYRLNRYRTDTLEWVGHSAAFGPYRTYQTMLTATRAGKLVVSIEGETGGKKTFMNCFRYDAGSLTVDAHWTSTKHFSIETWDYDDEAGILTVAGYNKANLHIDPAMLRFDPDTTPTTEFIIRPIISTGTQGAYFTHVRHAPGGRLITVRRSLDEPRVTVDKWKVDSNSGAFGLEWSDSIVQPNIQVLEVGGGLVHVGASYDANAYLSTWRSLNGQRISSHKMPQNGSSSYGLPVLLTRTATRLFFASLWWGSPDRPRISTFDVIAGPDDAYAFAFNEPISVDAAHSVLKNDPAGFDDYLSSFPLKAKQPKLMDGLQSVTLNPNGSFTAVKVPDFFGATGFTYECRRFSDSALLGTYRVTIALPPPAPIAVDDNYTRPGASNLRVLENDSDPAGGTLTVKAVTQAENGTVTIVSGGALVRFTPDPGFIGRTTFTYTVSNQWGGTATATVKIKITGS
jgi:hypothetical protein